MSTKPWDETWRVGGKVLGCTIYGEQHGTEGELIGLMYTREAAHLASAAPDLYRELVAAEWAADWMADGWRCHSCSGWKESGHLPGCARDAALKKARGEAP